MKHIAVILIIILSSALFAETLGDSPGFPFDDEKNNKKDTRSETETLLGSGYHISGFGGPYMTTGTINGEQVYFSGARGAAIFDRSFILGFGGCGLEYPKNRNDLSGGNYQGRHKYLQMHYGGLFTGWNFDQQEAFHMSFTTVIGGGKLFYSDIEEQEHEFGSHIDEDTGVEDFFVCEPALMLHLNVTRWLRLGGGVSYRYTKGIDNGELTDEDLNDWSAQFAVDFGWF